MARLKDSGEKRYTLQKDKPDASLSTGSTRKRRVRVLVQLSLVISIVLVVIGATWAYYIDHKGFYNFLRRAATVGEQGQATSQSTSFVGVTGSNGAQEGDTLIEAIPLLLGETSPDASVPLSPTTEFGRMYPTPPQSMPGTGDVVTLFAEAEELFGRGEWLDAISLYIQLRNTDATYESAEISQHLGIAYRNAALELIDGHAENDADLEQARNYLYEVVTMNPADVRAVEEYSLITAYLSGTRSFALQELSTAIEQLTIVLRARPTYLDGLAAQKLYEVYVSVGDLAIRRGESDVATSAYRQAEALELEGMDAATLRLQSMAELVKLTPTPYPANLPTVQAAALARGLPPVLLPTPTPGSIAESTGRAEYATAVALTTGTFTPEPEVYVTPILVIPSPPVENIATEVARTIEATARADVLLIPTNTPMPYNAVIGEYVYATPQPENAATASAQAVIAQANVILYGTPTPLPWNAIVITAVPPPLPTAPPTATPVPLLVPVDVLTPTPTPLPTAVAPATMPPELWNKIIFLSDRGGTIQTYLLDPLSGQISLVTQSWVYPLAQEQLGYAEDGEREAIVLADNNRVLQIQIRDHKYGTTQQITSVRSTQGSDAMAYDPAWSPTDDIIAYVSSEDAGDEIYTMNLADGIPHRLTNNAWEWDKHPTWSPDGSQIVFFSNRETGRTQLWIMNADGSNQRSLISSEYNDWNPVWIP